ncbi:MAG: hypothetical protein EPN31_07795 [Castellaniella sp.]|uniref:hypothetical protein n=1 Tax=Castellaniella sp. TaxID=1955812 RepID=UPI001225019B|nr:hypothetical protein [Castellaniella sp.]TAN28680.1 MAG: hypothetical protein EPN31_07795 [Castellaniella sp.]
MFYPYKNFGETRLTDALERELLIEAEQAYGYRSGEVLLSALQKAAAVLRRWLTSSSNMASAYWVSFHHRAA